jgi:hypothetical protein
MIYEKYAFRDVAEFRGKFPESSMLVMVEIEKADLKPTAVPGFQPKEYPSYDADALQKLTAREMARVARQEDMGEDIAGKLEEEGDRAEAGDPAAKTIKSTAVSGKIRVPALFATVMHEVCVKGRDVKLMIQASNKLNLQLKLTAESLKEIVDIGPEDLAKKLKSIFGITLRKEPDAFTRQMFAFYVHLFDRLSSDPLFGGIGIPGKDPGPPRKMQVYASFEPRKLHS